jgi:hypothetical protein
MEPNPILPIVLSAAVFFLSRLGRHFAVHVSKGGALVVGKHLCYYLNRGEEKGCPPGRLYAMKFTTLIPTTWNDGTPIKSAVLERVLDALWRPFRAMTKEGYVTGHWIDEDGTEFTDTCLKVFIECDRSRLVEAIKAVKRVGRRLRQRAMYFEVDGYDGVQILRIE